MKIVGLIAEYNPFHNGHEYHIEQTLLKTNADAVIVLMSGDFVQRGAPAVMPKHLRTRAALQCKASAVIELPVCFACGSAEYFARGAVSLFDALGCVDSICFGSECGDIGQMTEIARIFADEPDTYREILRNCLKSGLSFPAARRQALLRYTDNQTLAELLDLPNNTLGIEYIKAILRSGSSLKYHTLKRIGSGYHEQTLTSSFGSASAVRSLLHTADESSDPGDAKLFAQLEKQVPASSVRLLRENFRNRYPIYADDFSLLLRYRLLTGTADSLTEYADVTPDLANRIMKRQNEFSGWKQFCDLLKTRELTYTRISRALLHTLLGIRRSDMELYEDSGFGQYARVLGFSRSDSSVLKAMKTHAGIPLISKPAAARDLSRAGMRMLETDIFAANLYESVVSAKYGRRFINEYEQQIIIV